MDSSFFEGAVLDPVKCSKLSMEERREIVYELAKWSHGAAEMLQTWSRQDILQILCSEMGKERKYTGLTKLKIIEHLLKVVSEKNGGGDHNVGAVFEQQYSPSIVNKGVKRQRKPDNPTHIPISSTNLTALSDGDSGIATYCKNAACKATLSSEDAFCKRCSCCICYKFDDNKDPSLWLTCSSEPPFQRDSCNMSCHLECALKHERSGISRNGLLAQLDGSFYCISCGKMNDLMRCWRKQLIVAKETRRVDILCYRISLSQKLLAGTKKYQELSEIVDDAVKLLESEVGTLTGVPVKKARGIVNRLSSGQEVQRLCASAVESFDLMTRCTPLHRDNDIAVPSHVPTSTDSMIKAPSIIRVEAITSTSVTLILGHDSPISETNNNVGYTLWHRKADDDKKETLEPTCTLFPPQTRFLVSGLSPSTEYLFKVVCFDNTKELTSSELRLTTTSISNSSEDTVKFVGPERVPSPLTNCSTLSNPSSVEDETHNTNSSNEHNSTNANLDLNPSDDLKPDPKNSSSGQIGEAMSTDNRPVDPEKQSSPLLLPWISPETSLPITPSRVESSKDLTSKKGSIGPKSHYKDQDENGSGKRVKKQRSETRDEEGVGDGLSGSNLEYYIKVIRWLECEGHIEKSFRQKFLTWYSIRATPQESRIVKAFVDTLIEDPASLAEQLIDTFGELVSNKRSSVVSPGFCLKLWH